MIARVTGALLRAILVVILIATPSLVLPIVSHDTSQIVAFIALFAAALTFFEYASTYPGLVEFRYAPPFNRVRFVSLMLTIFLLAVVCKAQTHPTTMTQFIEVLGNKLGNSIDFPYSPVRLVTLMMPDGTPEAHLELVRTAAGLSYIISLVTLAIFVLLCRTLGWPSRDGVFNVWVNLPTFDPTTGGDVVSRLNRDARFNIALGFLLPFLIPAIVKAAAVAFEPVTLGSYQTLIWTMTAWAFLPASLFMRGIAMGRIADMIRERRRLNALAEDPSLQLA